MADRFPAWIRYSGVGLELAGATAGLALVGYWIDTKFGTSPWGIIGGFFIGIVGGLYNMVKESLAAAREARLDDAVQQDDAANASKERDGNGH
jgi:F0F1-type ATP synthase assembly protein I